MAGFAVVVIASRGSIQHPSVALLLAMLAALSYLSDRRWALTTWRLEADLPIWLIALVHCGPLSAFLIVAVTELARLVVERDDPPRRIASLATLASFAWAVLIGAALLRVLPGAHAQAIVERWPAYALAGAGMVIVNVLIVAGIVHCLLDGKPLPLKHFAAMLLPVPIAAGIACLYGSVGVPALALLPAVSWLPAALLKLATPILAPDASTLSRREAKLRYAIAIARALGLSRRDRRVLRFACRARHWDDPGGWESDGYEVGQALFYESFSERYGGGDWMPLTSCVLEFADAWAELTTTWQLAHPAALAHLERRDPRFSARVLRAAWHVVDEQPRHTGEIARLPVSHPLALRLTSQRG
ncbi:MAG: hypothetical protein M3Z06_15475 [Actinomycetota bacterium]|nr:hypothetical protein [Actinomycetota bacterium]